MSKSLIPYVFSKQLKSFLSDLYLKIKRFSTYEMTKSEKEEFLNNILKEIDSSQEVVDDYISYTNFENKKIKYKKTNLHSLLVEVKEKLFPFAKSKNVDIYLNNFNESILTNDFWLKKAINHIIYKSVFFEKEGGTVNIKTKNSIFGIYILIGDVSIKEEDLVYYFKQFYPIDKNHKGFDVSLALSKVIIESFGGEIRIKSKFSIGSDFIVYLPYTPKTIQKKRLFLSSIPISFILFLIISNFPIYSQNYKEFQNGEYISYVLEDGSIIKVTKNSKYELKLNKNLYNTKYTMFFKLKKGSVNLDTKDIENEILVSKNIIHSIKSDFEIEKNENVKIAVFNGKIKADNDILNSQEGMIINNNLKKITKLLDKVKNLKVTNHILTFIPNPKAIKYKIVISNNKEFSNIEDSFYTTRNKIMLDTKYDKLYFIKVFAYSKDGLPSIPAVTKFLNLKHYYNALKFLKKNYINEAKLELINSCETIQNYSDLPYYELAEIYFQETNFKKSLKLAQKALNINKSLKNYLLVIKNLMKLNENKELKPYLSKIIHKYPDNIEINYYYSLVLFNEKKYKKAENLLFKILQINPNYKEANILLSRVFYRLKNYKLAKYYENKGE